mgnify:CR=1 FL=1
MNKKRVHTPEGVRDVYGTEYGQRSKLKAKLNKVFASYGYEGIRTPGFEFFDVFNSEKEPYPQGKCLNSLIEKEIP